MALLCSREHKNRDGSMVLPPLRESRLIVNSVSVALSIYRNIYIYVCIALRAVRLFIYLRAGGVPTRHTRKWDGLHTRRLLEGCLYKAESRNAEGWLRASLTSTIR